jgi:malonyl-CoA decarboxylase
VPPGAKAPARRSRRRPRSRRWLAPRAVERPLAERLDATFRRGEEALSPRELRNMLARLHGIIDARVSEVEGGRRAKEVEAWYAEAPGGTPRPVAAHERAVHGRPEKVKKAQAQYAAALGTPDQAAAEVLYRRATVSPRRACCNASAPTAKASASWWTCAPTCSRT